LANYLKKKSPPNCSEGDHYYNTSIIS